jgi:hypothetical protein
MKKLILALAIAASTAQAAPVVVLLNGPLPNPTQNPLASAGLVATTTMLAGTLMVAGWELHAEFGAQGSISFIKHF